MSISCCKRSFSSSFLSTRAHTDTHTQTAAFHTFPEVRSILPKELGRPASSTAPDEHSLRPLRTSPITSRAPAPWLLFKTDMQRHTHTHHKGTSALPHFRHHSTVLGGRRSKARQLEHLGEGTVSWKVMESHCRSVWRPRCCRVYKATWWLWVRWDFGSILTDRPY